MKTRIFLLLISILSLTSCQDSRRQTSEFDFDIHNQKLSFYIIKEKELQSQEYENKYNHISKNGIAQPIKFRRNQNVIPDLITQYFYYEKDSSISYILHEWDINNFKEEFTSKQTENFTKEMILKYDELETLINSKFGESKAEGILTDLSQIESRNGLNKSNLWQPNDSTEIELYTHLSNYFEEKGNVTIKPSFRIRLYIRNKSKRSKPTLSPLLTKNLEENANTFFSYLSKGAFEQAKKSLSPKIESQITNEQLSTLNESINLKRGLMLSFSGYQTSFSGERFILLQFKYEDDKSSPPKEMIKVIFDSSEKIIGVQPLMSK